MQTFRGASLPFRLPRELSAAVAALGRREGASLFMTLLAALQTVLLRHSGQADLVLGSPIANRNRVETEGLIGFFVNTLVLRTDLSGDPAFRELLARVRDMALDAYAHQDLPFEKLVEELQPRRDLAYTPLFQVSFGFQNAPAETAGLPWLDTAPLGGPAETAKFDLTLAVTDADGVLSGHAEYSRDLFDAPTVRRLLAHWESVLDAACADAGRPLSEVPALTGGERQQLLVEWAGLRSARLESLGRHRLLEAEAEHALEVLASFPPDRLEVLVLDVLGGPAPIGVVGEVCLTGPGLAGAHLDEPGATALRLVPQAGGEPGARLFRTGELARHRPDGGLELLGRAERRVRVRGFRVDLESVEAILAEHPQVREAVVLPLGQPGGAESEGEPRLVAWVVGEEGWAPDAADLRAWLRRRLPEPMVPAALVPLSALPLTPAGRVDLAALPAPVEEARPAAAFVAPQSELEATLLAVWKEALGRDEIGIHDNFFDLGGHSLLIAEVNHRLQQALGREIPMMAHFQFTTVSALAEYLEQGEGGDDLSFEERQARAETRKAAMGRQRRMRQRVRSLDDIS